MIAYSIVLAIVVRTQTGLWARVVDFNGFYLTIAASVTFLTLTPVGVDLVYARGPVLTDVVNTFINVCGAISTSETFRTLAPRMKFKSKFTVRLCQMVCTGPYKKYTLYYIAV